MGAERRPGKLPFIVLLFLGRLSVEGLLLSWLIGLQSIKLQLKGGEIVFHPPHLHSAPGANSIVTCSP